MTFLTKFFIYIFSPVLIDLNRFRQYRDVTIVRTDVTDEYAEQKQKLRRRHRPYKKRKYKKREFYRERTFKLQGTWAKDNRYSNQKSLRRMYRSC